jgi:hypothetical protein
VTVDQALLDSVDWPAVAAALDVDPAADDPHRVFAERIYVGGRWCLPSAVEAGGINPFSRDGLELRWFLQRAAICELQASGAGGERRPIATPPPGPSVFEIDAAFTQLPLVSFARSLTPKMPRRHFVVELDDLDAANGMFRRTDTAGVITLGCHLLTRPHAELALVWAHELGHATDPAPRRAVGICESERFADDFGGLLLEHLPESYEEAAPLIEQALSRRPSTELEDLPLIDDVIELLMFRELPLKSCPSRPPDLMAGVGASAHDRPGVRQRGALEAREGAPPRRPQPDRP